MIARGAGIGGFVAGVGLLDKLLVAFECSMFTESFEFVLESSFLSISFITSVFLSPWGTPELSLFLNTNDAGMLNVLSDLSNNLGDEDGEQSDLLMADSEDSVGDGGAEFLPNNGLNLLRDFGLGERSQLFNDRRFGLGVRLKSRLRLALNLKWD